MTWPNIQDPSGISESYAKAQLKSKFESGRVISRSKDLRARHKWVLSWDALPESDLEVLKAAFNTDIGETFSWYHGRRETSYTVRYSKDSIESEYVGGGFYKVSVEIEED